MEQKTIIIVVPCYNEQEVLADSNKKLLDLLQQMISNQLISDESRILYVNDGSKDKTWELIAAFSQKNKHVSGIKLAKNAGHQNALLSGLTVGKEWGDALISIDADLQDDIHVIPEMVRKFLEGKDIVYGVRKKRTTDSWFKRTTALGFYNLMHYLGVKSVYNHADFRLMSKRAVEQLCKFRERNLFLRGMVPLIGYETDCVYYDRAERLAGESKYPIGKMVNFAIDGITSFSTKPVRMVFGLGVAFLFVALFILIWVFYSFMIHRVVPGWASIILSIWFVGACILMGLGIVGEYIGKIYIEVKDRPRFNIEKIVNHEQE